MKTAEVDEQKAKYLQHFINKHDTIVSNFTCILHLLNNTCVKHNFKSVHVSNLFWSREYNSAKEICKYPSFSKVGGNYPLDLKIIWSSVFIYLKLYILFLMVTSQGLVKTGLYLCIILSMLSEHSLTPCLCIHMLFQPIFTTMF